MRLIHALGTYPEQQNQQQQQQTIDCYQDSLTLLYTEEKCGKKIRLHAVANPYGRESERERE